MRLKTSMQCIQACATTCRFIARQRGAALIVSLLMLTVVLMLGISAAHIALQGEKASRNDRDRQIAMQAAEAALIDAESDIEHSPRSHLFNSDRTDGFTESCGSGQPNIYLGLCSQAEHADIPVWQRVDFMNTDGQAHAVTYGHFTGHVIQTGPGLLPALPPRYIIERISYSSADPATDTENPTYFYRITAVGFGMRDITQVALQTFYRKKDGGKEQTILPAGRFGWREISNWQELHNAFGK